MLNNLETFNDFQRSSVCDNLHSHKIFFTIFSTSQKQNKTRKTRNLINAPEFFYQHRRVIGKKLFFPLRPPRRANNWRNSFNWINQYVFYCLRLNDCEKFFPCECWRRDGSRVIERKIESKPDLVQTWFYDDFAFQVNLMTLNN